MTGFSLNRKIKLIAGIGLVVLIVSAVFVDYNLTGFLGGVFILEGQDGSIVEIKDDINPKDIDRLLFSLNVMPLWELFLEFRSRIGTKNFMLCDWNERQGNGYIIDHYPDGRKFFISFSRHKEDSGDVPSGLFVGGGLPRALTGNSQNTYNETGVAYFDGKRWYHIWCSVNESIASALRPEAVFSPAQWKFLGSRLYERSAEQVTLWSGHEVRLDSGLMRIDRFVFFHAGESYFTLLLKFSNVGGSDISYSYVYGDEPWLGDYGSSLGNVGWLEDGMVLYEAAIDPRKYNYAGFYDYGNFLIGEGNNFTRAANFIEWSGSGRPDLVYFSNTIGSFNDESKKVPLSSKDTRFLGLQWGPKVLKPQNSHSVVLAIGMAGHDAKLDFPVKPATRKLE
ncbi:MAG: hypothetical protein EPN22_04780 [Nitrospirae bacterium]|nr:MAG: hypothetical protein EPN22_04780 [Nitrospirota bacterium]